MKIQIIIDESFGAQFIAQNQEELDKKIDKSVSGCMCHAQAYWYHLSLGTRVTLDFRAYPFRKMNYVLRATSDDIRG